MFDAPERELRAAGLSIRERVERGGGEFRSDEAAREDPLHLRREDESAVDARQIERLDPEAIARGDQKAIGPVIEEKGELTSQMLETAEAELLVQIENDLRIRLRAEAVALCLERSPDPFEIVNLTVRREDDIAVVGLQRLRSGNQVDDREPSVSERELCRFVDEQPAAVRAPMVEDAKHVLECRIREVAADRTEDSTHDEGVAPPVLGRN